MNSIVKSLCGVGLLTTVVGCATSPEVQPTTTLAPIAPVNIPINAEAGVPLQQSADQQLLMASISRAAQRSRVGTRSDAFALRSDERQFDTRQNAERVLGVSGYFAPQFDPPQEAQATPPPVVEPQPYRRLAGVVVGDSVLALIDMGNGTTELVRPGQQIPGTEWTVVSIDEEKAILRRGGNRLPRQVTVRLELPPPGFGGGNPGGGFPGGPGGPPGGPGGPGTPGGAPEGQSGGLSGAGG